MAKAARITEEIVGNRKEVAGAEVTLVNFGDKPRVLNDNRGRPFNVPIGGAVTKVLPHRTIERVMARTPTLMAIPKELVEHTEAPLMKQALAALRDFDGLSHEEAIYIHDKVFGRGHLSMRPTKPEIRMALAKRCKDAAEYIAAGAYDTAQKLLGEGRPEPVKLEQSGVGLAVKDPDLVEGDKDDEEEGDGNTGDGGSGDGTGEGGHGENGGTARTGADGDGGGAQPGALSGDGKPGSDAAPGTPDGQGGGTGDGTPRRVHSVKQND